MKSTPLRGVKQTLKPDAHEQSEPGPPLGEGAGDGVPFA